MAFCTTCGANVNGAFCPQCGTPVSAAQAAPPPAPPPQPQAAPSSAFNSQPSAFNPQPIQPGYSMVPPAGPPRRGMSPVLIVILVIFGILFLGVVGMVGLGLYAAHAIAKNPGTVVAKLLTAGNPNVEVLNTDNGAGTITFRDKATGKVSTITFDQAKNGQWSMTANDDKGGTATMKFGAGANLDLPGWIPQYPGATSTGGFSATGTDNSGKGNGGTFAFTTPDDSQKVLDWYKDKAAGIGLKVNMNTTTPTGGMIIAANEGEKQTLSVIANREGPQTTVNITYAEKR